jgi:transketolase
MTDISRISVVTSLDDIATLARQLRVDSIRMSTRAGSGHPTSSLSAADLMAVLLARHLSVDWADSRHRGNDHLIFSKGHASPLLYAMFKAAGVVSDDELMTRYRRVGSPWMGHPTPALPWVDVATGSLGQGLPVGVGISLAGQFLERADYHVWVLCGDSEMAEGSMWEALDKAGHFGLGNLTAIVDVNELGMRGPTALGWDLERYAARVRAFGCDPVVVDGHDIKSIDAALRDARRDGLPTVVLARTVKGRGVPELEDRNAGTASPCRATWPPGPSPTSAVRASCASNPICRRRHQLRHISPRTFGYPSIGSANRFRHARRTGRRWRRWARIRESSWWTRRSATPRTPSRSSLDIPSGTSTCSPPSSR